MPLPLLGAGSDQEQLTDERVGNGSCLGKVVVQSMHV